MKRLSCIVTKSEIQAHLGDVELETSLTHAYAIDVHDPMTIIISHSGRCIEARWGLNPVREKSTINLPYVSFLRVHVKPTFRMAFRQCRAIAVIDSFYCWNKDESLPYRVRMKQSEPMFIPCVYQSVHGQPQSYTCSLLVREAESTMNTCTDVEPMIFSAIEIKKWLNHIDVSEAIEILNRNQRVKFNQQQVSNKVMIKGYSDKSLHQDNHREMTLFG